MANGKRPMATPSAINHRHQPSAISHDGCSLYVLADKLRHLEHVDLRLAAEHRLERVVRFDHPLVLLVLQAVLLDVGPQLLGDLGAGARFGSLDFAERSVRPNW